MAFSFALLGISAAMTPRLGAQSLPPAVDKHVKRATVMVITSQSKNTEGDTPVGSGTGFFVNRTGLCITNDHVIDPGHGKDPAEKMRIWKEMNRLTWKIVADSGTPDEKEYKANVLYSNDQADMAVLQVYDDKEALLDSPHYLKFFPSDEVEPKTVLWNFGFPGGDSRRQTEGAHPKVAVQSGNVVELPRSPSGRIKGIVTNILVNQGNSGGPAVDVQGRLVGIATLAGGGDTGRSAVSLLIPADLSKEMIRITFAEGRVPNGVDLFPFLRMLLDGNLRYRIPHLERSDNNTCIKMRNSGSLLCGKPASRSIKWVSPIGRIDLPVSATAYMVRRAEDDVGAVLLDGGNRLLIDADEGSIEFSIGGANPFPIDLRDVESIAFQLPSESPKIPKGDVLVIGGADYNLAFKELKGDIVFGTSGSLTIPVPVASIALIETTDSGEVRLHTANGSIMTGRFKPHELTGELAWTGTPITFSLESISNAVFRTVNYAQTFRQGEPPLTLSLTTNDERFIRLATALDHYDLPRAESALQQLLEPDVQRAFTKSKKEELRRLEGEYLFRSGKFEQAAEVFKRLTRSDVEDVRWHAQARTAMLERYPNGEFDGKSLTDPAVFGDAATALTSEDIQVARRSLEELERSAEMGMGGSPVDRTEYNKLVRRARDTEDSLLVANRLRGGTTEGLIVRLWRTLSNLHLAEAARLEKERQAFQNESGRRSSGGRAAALDRQRERKMTRFERDIESAVQAAQKLQIKIRDAGFIIDDSDLDVGAEG